jgi:hypothetical protein
MKIYKLQTKSFITLGTGVCYIKIFMEIIFGVSNKIECLPLPIAGKGRSLLAIRNSTLEHICDSFCHLAA